MIKVALKHVDQKSKTMTYDTHMVLKTIFNDKVVVNNSV